VPEEETRTLRSEPNASDALPRKLSVEFVNEIQLDPRVLHRHSRHRKHLTVQKLALERGSAFDYEVLLFRQSGNCILAIRALRIMKP
jgi:hypothetical protein